jgi:hypothetical protein
MSMAPPNREYLAPGLSTLFAASRVVKLQNAAQDRATCIGRMVPAALTR